jgi:hypothetical protein
MGENFMKTDINLDEFYLIIRETVPVKRRIADNLYHKKTVCATDIEMLNSTYNKLLEIPEKDGKKLIKIGSNTIPTDLGYEIEELKRDLLFLEKDELSIISYLKDIHANFDIQVNKGLGFLKGSNPDILITDRDGTINNYCGRYLSSIQSIYNSYFISRFASVITDSIILTSAPLQNGGIIDININPSGLFHYAGSKGREYQNKKGQKHSFAISREKQGVLDKLNKRLKSLVNQDQFKIFSYIGSGLQFKFGQTTIARQDIYSSIPLADSENMLKTVTQIVNDIDPQSSFLRIEDTGKDIEIMLTVENGSSGIKDYDKGEGVQYLDKELNLGLNLNQSLICGDTFSDLPMVKTACKKNSQTKAIFVTEDESLVNALTDITPNSFTVSSPDVLITILYNFSKGL